MRYVSGAVLLALFPLLAPVMAQDSRARAGQEPAPPLRGEAHVMVDVISPLSLKKLCDESDMIVDGTVETAQARMTAGRGANVETDFWVAVSRVLKGPAETRKVVVSELGGTFGEFRLIPNYALLETGSRYILFLMKDTRTSVPAIAGLVRFRANPFDGKVQVVEGRAQVPERNTLAAKFHRGPVDSFIDAVLVALRP